MVFVFKEAPKVTGSNKFVIEKSASVFFHFQTRVIEYLMLQVYFFLKKYFRIKFIIDGRCKKN